MTLNEYEEGLVAAFSAAYTSAGGSNLPEVADIVERLRDEAAITIEEAQELGRTDALHDDESRDGFC